MSDVRDGVIAEAPDGASPTRRTVARYGAIFGLLTLVALTLSGCDILSSNSYAAPTPGSSNGNAVAVYNQAQALAGHGQCKQAIPLYLRAINMNAIYVAAYRALASCYQDASVGNLNAAILMYDKALQIDPTNFGIYLDRAGAEVNNGNTGAATTDALTALRLAPPQAPSYISIANTFASFQDLADQAKAIGKAIEVAPGTASLYEQRANVYLEMNDTSSAFADYNRALRVTPFTEARAGIYADLADVYSGQQDYASAFRADATAIKLQPNNAGLYVRSGNVHEAAGDYTGALGLYNAALRHVLLQPDAEAAHEGKADTLIKLGQDRAALAEYDKAARLANTNATRHELSSKLSSLAATYDQQQEYTFAFRVIALAIKLQPGTASLYLQSGNIHLDAGAPGTAITLYDQALRYATATSDLEAAHEAKGDAYAKMKQAAKAIAEYRHALRLTTDPDTQTRLNDKIKTTK